MNTSTISILNHISDNLGKPLGSREEGLPFPKCRERICDLILLEYKC